MVKALKRDRVRLVHKVLAPNQMIINIPSDFAEQWRPLLAQLELELAGSVQTTTAKLAATELIGPVTVQLKEDPALSPGQVRVLTAFARQMAGPASLVALSGLPQGQALPLVKPVTTLGRGEVDLRLPASCRGVSRLHARIMANREGYLVEDLGSSGGTFVNGQEIKLRGLSTGDRLSLGEVELRFQAGGRS